MSLTDGIDGLSEDQVAAIKANEAKQYEGYESPDQVSGLKANNQELLEEKRQATQKATDAAKAAEAAALETAKKSGDIEALTKSFEAKILEERALGDVERNKTAALVKKTEDAAINAAVTKMAVSLAKDSAVVLEPHIKERLRYEDGEIKVTDSKGGLTISKIEDLAAEFKNNPAFASVIVGSQANGGGAPKGNEGSGGGAPSDVKWSDMTTEQRAAHLAANPPQRK